MTQQIPEQPPRGVPKKRCFENMQPANLQENRTPMPKNEFNKVDLQLY